jgi:hypothetical protein
MRKSIFKDRVTEIYQTEFQPLLDNLIDREISQSQALICEASNMNDIRWAAMRDNINIHINTTVLTAEDLIEYLDKRKNFLDGALDSISDYNNVYVDLVNVWANGIDYLISVRTGELVKLPEPEFLGITNFVRWINAETGEEFDQTLPITRDIRIQAEVRENNVIVDLINNNKSKIYYAASLCMFLFAFGSLLVMDIRRNGKGVWFV